LTPSQNASRLELELALQLALGVADGERGLLERA